MIKGFHGLVGGIRDGNSQWKRAKKINQCLLANVNMFVTSRECRDKVWGTMLVTYKTVLCEIQNDEYKLREIFI